MENGIEKLIRAAIQASEAGDHERSLQLCQQAANLAKGAGRSRELSAALRVCAAALLSLEHHNKALRAANAAIEAATAAQDSRAEAYAKDAKADVLRTLGRNQEALRVAEEAVDAARAVGDKLAEANALLSKAEALRRLGRYDAALQAAEEAVDTAKAARNHLARASALVLKAEALRMLDRYKEALDAAEQAVAAATRAQNRLTKANALCSKASVLGRLGRYQEALQAAEEATEFARGAGSKLAVANALTRKAEDLRMLARYEEALEAAQQAVRAARAAGDKFAEANALDSMADALRMLGRYQEALQAAQQAVEAASSVGSKRAEANALLSKAEALRVLNRLEEALQALDHATTAARAARDRLAEANALRSRADALRMLGRYEEGIGGIEDAIKAARELGDKLGEANALAWKALTLLGAGGLNAAIEASSEAARIAFDLGITSAQRLVGRVQLVVSFAVAYVAERDVRRWVAAAPITREGLQDVPKGTEGIFAVVRGYASYAAAGATQLEGWVGGGYFLWWRGTGIVIDPGSHFVDLMRTRSRFHPADISAVIVTHKHVDHAGDLTAVLSLLHELAEQKAGDRDKNSPGAHPMPQLLLGPNVAQVPNWPVVDLSPGEKEQIGNVHVIAFRTQHEDLGPAKRGCRGLRFELLDEDGATAGVVAVTSDTGWFDELPQHLLGDAATARDDRDPVPLLVIAHLGDIYEEDLEEGPQGKTARHHLGHKGVEKLFREIDSFRTEGDSIDAKPWPWLGVVTEWGPALALREGIHARMLQRGLRAGLICPGILGMEIALPQMQPICQYCRRRLADRWLEIPVAAPDQTWASALPFPRPPRQPLAGDAICIYVCKEHDQSLASAFSALNTSHPGA